MAALKDTQPAIDRDGMLEAISAAICEKRSEAIKGRQQAHIETIWTEDNEFYEGYDDANRHEFKTASTKPTEGGRSTEPKKRKGSTLFPNITAPYVDMASAKIADMLMGSADWRPFAVKPTPVPRLINPPKVPAPTPAPNAAQIMGNPAAPGQPMTQQAPPDPLAQLLAKAKAQHAAASEAAKKAEDAIDDALVECQYEDEMREVIHDAARLGTGIIKGPEVSKRKDRVAHKDEETGEFELLVEISMEPGSRRVDPRYCYPDYPACGEDIHNGNYFLEYAPCTEKQLRALMGGTGPAKYLDDQIKKCLDEGPNKTAISPMGGDDPTPEGVFPRWYFYGMLSGKDLQTVGCECDDEQAQYPVIATLVNDRIVKVALNPLDANEFPYDFLVWKKRAGMPWGIGVARQARTGQRIATAGVRNLMDNAGASAKPHKVMTDAIVQGSDPWTWIANTEISDVRGAMQFFEQPSRQQELNAIIERGLRQVELETGLPMTVLGIEGPQEETARGRTILNNNGSTVLRRIARNFDSATEAHVRRYYRWLLLYSDDEKIKGDMQIQARGSSALVERDMQSQQLPMIHEMAKDPGNRMSRIKTRDELLKSMHFDPATFEMSDEELAELENTPPPKAPQVEVAEINAEKDKAVTQIKEEGATQRAQMQSADKAADRRQEAQESEADRQLALVEQQVLERIQAIKTQGAREETIDELRAMLAATAIKVQAQRDLSAQDAAKHIATHQTVTPPSEPAGRAQPGEAYQQ